MKNIILFLWVSILIMGCKTENMPENLVIAHRGMPHHAPEETTPSYILARDLGADYLEADLQRTKDGVIIALHDNDLQRTTNINDVFPERASEPVNKFTWDELMQLDAGSWFNKINPDNARESYNGLKIISLEQLINIAEQGENPCGIYLETKHPDLFPGIEEDLKRMLLEKGWYQERFSNGRPKVILQTFSANSLKLLNKHFPQTPICYLWWAGEGCLETVDESHVNKCLDFAIENGAGIIGPSFSGEQTNYPNLLEPWIIELIRDRNLDIHAYTFDTRKDIDMYASSCQGQFTNRTDLLLDYYDRSHNDISKILENYNY